MLKVTENGNCCLLGRPLLIDLHRPNHERRRRRWSVALRDGQAEQLKCVIDPRAS